MMLLWLGALAIASVNGVIVPWWIWALSVLFYLVSISTNIDVLKLRKLQTKWFEQHTGL